MPCCAAWHGDLSIASENQYMPKKFSSKMSNLKLQIDELLKQAEEEKISQYFQLMLLFYKLAEENKD